jgi:nucleoside-diphosphate-sugar epimerase
VPSFTPSDPLPLTGMRVFVTGGTGFVGRSVLDYLLRSTALHGSKDVYVCILSRDPVRFLRKWPRYAGLGWLRFVEGDLQSLRRMRRQACDHVIHAAADTHGVASGASWIEQIVGGTHAALDFALLNRARRFLLLSSGAIYGAQPLDMGLLPETFAGAPSPTLYASVYGQAKRMAEQLCAVYWKEHGLESVIARCFALVGEHVPLSGSYAIGNFIRNALDGQPLRLTGDGSATRSYLYGPDAAHWLVTLLLRGSPGEAYNVGSDAAISIRELAELTAARLSSSLPVVVGPATAADNARSRYVPDISKAAALGLTVSTPLPQAIELSAQLIKRHYSDSTIRRSGPAIALEHDVP